MIKSGISSKIGFEKTYLIDTRNPTEKDYGKRIPAKNFAEDIFAVLTLNSNNGKILVPTDNPAVAAIATNSDADANVLASLQKLISSCNDTGLKRIFSNILQNLVDNLTGKN